MASMRICPRCSERYPDDARFCPGDGARLTPGEERSSLVGICLDGRYLLEEQIGAGGLGQVYRGRHQRMDKAFAVKLLLPTLVAQEDIRRRFEREAQVLSRLTHPCCVGVSDYGISAEHGPYIVMDLVDGVPLSQYTRGEGLPLAEGVELVSMVLLGLKHAHDQGIAHRDLKPDNIMLVKRPLEPERLLPKILDFGLAKIRTGLSGTGTELTQAGLLVGTPAYMAPERFAVNRAADADETITDIYSVGIILYEICCGRRPFVDDDMIAVVDMQLNQPPPPPRGLRPSLPAGLETVVLRALDKQPARRFPTAAAFRDALKALPPLSGALARERPPGARGRSTAASTRVEGRQSEGVLPTLAADEVGEPSHGPRQGGHGAGLSPGPSGGEPPRTAERGSSAQHETARSRWPLLLGAGATAVCLVAGLLLLFGGDPAPPARAVATRASKSPPDAAPTKADRRAQRSPAPSTTRTDPDVVPPALRRATRLWHSPHQRQLAAKQLMGYLAHHRTDAAAHLHVGRLYLYAFWADDGLRLVQKALRIDPNLRLDHASLMALTFAYRGSTLWRARGLLDRHGGSQATVVLLASAAAMRDMQIKRNLIHDARARGTDRDPLARRLLALAQARSCKRRRAALAALEGDDHPALRIMLSLLGHSRCFTGLQR